VSTWGSFVRCVAYDGNLCLMRYLRLAVSRSRLTWTSVMLTPFSSAPTRFQDVCSSGFWPQILEPPVISGHNVSFDISRSWFLLPSNWDIDGFISSCKAAVPFCAAVTSALVIVAPVMLCAYQHHCYSSHFVPGRWSGWQPLCLLN